MFNQKLYNHIISTYNFYPSNNIDLVQNGIKVNGNTIPYNGISSVEGSYIDGKGIIEVIKNFHLFLSLYDFKDKSNWEQYDNRTLDAFTFEIMADIFDFSESNACKVYKGLKKKFDNHYEKFGIIFQRYDPYEDCDEIRTFKDLGKPRKGETRLEYVPLENFEDSYQSKRKII